MKKVAWVVSLLLIVFSMSGCGFFEEHLVEYIEVRDSAGSPANNVTLISMPTINIELKNSYGIEILSGTGYRHAVPLEHQDKSGVQLDASIFAIRFWGGLAVKDVELVGTTVQITASIANTY